MAARAGVRGREPRGQQAEFFTTLYGQVVLAQITPLRFAPDMLASLRLAFAKFAFEKLALEKLPETRYALVKPEFEKFTLFIQALLKIAPVKFTPVKVPAIVLARVKLA
jgi:hypothetical protein